MRGERSPGLELWGGNVTTTTTENTFSFTSHTQLLTFSLVCPLLRQLDQIFSSVLAINFSPRKVFTRVVHKIA